MAQIISKKWNINNTNKNYRKKVSMKFKNAKKIRYLELEEMYSIYSPHHNMNKEIFFNRLIGFDKIK